MENIDKNKVKQILKNSIIQSTSKDELLQRLRENNIDMFFRTNAANRIYGITIIDHNAKIIINGSKLGKEFSANIFQSLFEKWENKQSLAEEAKVALTQERHEDKINGEENAENTLQQNKNDFAENFVINNEIPELSNSDSFEAIESTLAFTEFLAGLLDVDVEPHREKKFVPDKNDDDEKKRKKKKKNRRL